MVFEFANHFEIVLILEAEKQYLRKINCANFIYLKKRWNMIRGQYSRSQVSYVLSLLCSLCSGKQLEAATNSGILPPKRLVCAFPQRAERGPVLTTINNHRPLLDKKALNVSPKILQLMYFLRAHFQLWEVT